MVMLATRLAVPVAVNIKNGNEPVATARVFVPACGPSVQRALAVPSEPVKIEEWSTLPPPDVTVQVTVAPASGFPD